VKPIEDMELNLAQLSEEEKTVLETLFSLTQKIEEIERNKEIITAEITSLQAQKDILAKKIMEKEQDYELQLEVLKKVLVSYQRGGPASYLEILLSAEDFTTFLKSINVIKDLSRNVSELLVEIDLAKEELQQEKVKLDEKALELVQKEAELQENLHNNQLLQQEQEAYLASLQEKRIQYEVQLEQLEQLWNDNKALFSTIVSDITRIIEQGSFTLEDMNITFGFFKITGALEEDAFNRVLNEDITLENISFRFHQDQAILEVTPKHLILKGNFILTEEGTIEFKVEEGSFFDIPLEQASIDELFQNGAFILDFKTIAKDFITIDYVIKTIRTEDKRLVFEVKPLW
jgi:peptidoglycan hydrolase CwlO-like protein